MEKPLSEVHMHNLGRCCFRKSLRYGAGIDQDQVSRSLAGGWDRATTCWSSPTLQRGHVHRRPDAAALGKRRFNDMRISSAPTIMAADSAANVIGRRLGAGEAMPVKHPCGVPASAAL
jgi:hypothetical protein